MKIIKNFIGNGISYPIFTIIISGYFSLVINLPVYKELAGIFAELDSVKAIFILSIPVFFFSVINLLFSLFSWPYLSKPFFSLLVLISSMVSYAGYNYGVMFDDGMIVNVLETNSSEVSSYFSIYSIFWVVIFGFIPAILILKAPLRPVESKLKFLFYKLISVFLSISIIVIIASGYYQDYSSIGRNNSYLRKMIIPTQFIYSTSGYIREEYFSSPMKYIELGMDAKLSKPALIASSDKPSLVVLVVGETARSQSYELNGYHKPTNAHTRELGVISFKDVESCGTATAVSVPCMFSNMTRDNFSRKRADNQDNVLDILQRSGISLLWKDNDGGDKGVAKNINKVKVDNSSNNTLCNGSTCYDMALLEGFNRDIESLSGNRIIVMHMIGSHGPTYFQRYPSSHAEFTPDCPRSDIENCTIEELVNTYDNTILYSDYVISQIVKQLKSYEDKYNTALIYISDHGESLGEGGIFLHGMPYSLAPDYQTKVPLLLWMSDGFISEKLIDENCLKRKSKINGKYSHDYLSHSLLGIMDVETNVYKRNLDIFYNCRGIK